MYGVSFALVKEGISKWHFFQSQIERRYRGVQETARWLALINTLSDIFFCLYLMA